MDQIILIPTVKLTYELDREIILSNIRNRENIHCYKATNILPKHGGVSVIIENISFSDQSFRFLPISYTFVEDIIKLCGYMFPENLVKDKIFMEECTLLDENFISYLHPSSWDDENFLLCLFEKNSYFITRISDRLKNDRDWNKTIIQKYPHIVHYIPETLKDDRLFMLDLIKSDKTYWYGASDRLRKKESFILDVITIHGIDAFCSSMTECLKKESIFKLLNMITVYFIYLPEEYCDDKSLIMEIGSKYKCCVKNMSDRLLDDKEFMISIMKLTHSCMDKASDRLKDDEEFVFEMIRKYSHHFIHASERLKNDHTFVEKCIQKNGFVYQTLPTKIKEDIILSEKLIKWHPHHFDDIPETLKNNPEFLLKIISYDEYIMEKINPIFLEDEQFILSLLEINIYHMKYISEKIRNDVECMKRICSQYHQVMKYLPKKWIYDFSTAFYLFQHTKNFFQYYPSVKMVLKIVQKTRKIPYSKEGIRILLQRFLFKKSLAKKIYLLCIHRNKHAYRVPFFKKDRNMILVTHTLYLFIEKHKWSIL